MEDTREPIRFLTTEDIYKINIDLIKSFGGWIADIPNLRQGISLDYMFLVISQPIYNLEAHPTIIDKAAYIAWYIITRHPFYDTNKRTAIQAVIEFLELNGHNTNFDTIDVIEKVIAVENKSFTYNDLRDWIARNIRHE